MNSSHIYKALLLVCFLGAVFAQKPQRPSSAELAEAEAKKKEFDEEELRLAEEKLQEEQASNAAYQFATSLVDGIMDNNQDRTEVRDGKNVTGSYSYSDGWFHHWISYVADQFGYRIVSEKSEAIGEGPKIDLDGKADVHTSIAGQEFEYSITKADIGKLNDKRKLKEKTILVEEN